jgi:transcriptional regulator with XRE-family HTH domain
MDLATLGRNIANVRRAKNLTQENVAFDLDISKTSYAKIERGETNISFLRLVQIADYFHIDVSELVKGSTSEVDLQEIAAHIAQMQTDIHSIKVAMDI